MLAINEAIEIAERWRGGKIYSAGDCGDRWVFSFEEDRNSFSGYPVFVFKADGRCESFCVAEYMDSLFGGEITCTPVALPKG